MMSRYILLALFGIWLGLWTKGTLVGADSPVVMYAIDSVSGLPVPITTDGSGSLNAVAQ